MIEKYRLNKRKAMTLLRKGLLKKTLKISIQIKRKAAKVAVAIAAVANLRKRTKRK